MGEQQATQEVKPSVSDGGARRANQVWTFFFLVVTFVVFLLFLWQAVPVLLLFFAATLIAVALRFLSDNLSRWTKIPPLWSLTIVLVLLFLGLGGAVVLSAPGIWEQVRQFGEVLRDAVEQVQDRLRGTEVGEWVTDRLTGEENFTENLSQLWTGVAGVFGTAFGAIAGFALTLLVAVFLAYNPRLYLAGLLRLVPTEKRPRAGEIIDELGYTLRWWMVGQLISMLVLAVSTWLMLWLLGVPLAFMLGLLTGLLTFIPYLGPLIALAPILLIAFVEDPTLALWVLALYLIIQNAEANILMPLIFKKTVHLPPALTVVAQVLLGGILGFVGVVLATPLLVAGIVLVKRIYVQDVIGDDLSEPPLKRNSKLGMTVNSR